MRLSCSAVWSVTSLAGLIKAAGFLLGVDVPVVVFQIGSFTAHPLLTLPLSALVGVLFLWRERDCGGLRSVISGW